MCITGAMAMLSCGTTGRLCIAGGPGLRMRRASWYAQRYPPPRWTVLIVCVLGWSGLLSHSATAPRSAPFEIRQAPFGHRVDAFLEILRLAQAGLLLEFVVGCLAHTVGDAIAYGH